MIRVRRSCITCYRCPKEKDAHTASPNVQGQYDVLRLLRCFVLSQGLSPYLLLCHQQDRSCERGRSEHIEVRGELAEYEQEAYDQIGQELPNAARDAEPAHAESQDVNKDVERHDGQMEDVADAYERRC